MTAAEFALMRRGPGARYATRAGHVSGTGPLRSLHRLYEERLRVARASAMLAATL